MLPDCKLATPAQVRRVRLAIEQDAIAFAQSEPEPFSEPKTPEFTESRVHTERRYTNWRLRLQGVAV
jgi:hypothetical protein